MAKGKIKGQIMCDPSEFEKKLKDVEEKIAEVKRRMPAHSVKPPIMTELIDLEDQRDEILARLNRTSEQT